MIRLLYCMSTIYLSIWVVNVTKNYMNCKSNFVITYLFIQVYKVIFAVCCILRKRDCNCRMFQFLQLQVPIECDLGIYLVVLCPLSHWKFRLLALSTTKLWGSKISWIASRKRWHSCVFFCSIWRAHCRATRLILVNFASLATINPEGFIAIG